MPSNDHGLTNRFKVIIDGMDLGGWSGCQGLGVSFNPFPYEAGGDYQFVHYLAGQVKYGNVKFTRAMTASTSKQVQEWLRARANEHDAFEGGLAYSDHTAQITLHDASNSEVITWELRGAHPGSWSGPTFDANSSGVAIETLELVHEGFL
jgi:phage tail-like protein